ncbi:hypothetical protein CK203_082637 [Vitis vinifera]|uniref:Reverse transcriptase Ty1/copia-type domain-containing protein n=1 Tax=Vitis vinifera TaxID=29760 RepID=A0A438BWK6_VITVI|nr:hypothetical protein CK203_082637 [Vitis vinifera]
MDESTLYIKVINDELIVVSSYVDGLLVTRSNAELVKQFKAQMMQAFEMTDLGEMAFFLGLEIQQSQQGNFIGQLKYTKESTEEIQTRRIVCHYVPFWLKMRNLKKMIVLQRYMHCASELHNEAAKRVLGYITGTLDLRIKFEKEDQLVLHGFANSD